MDWKSLTDKLNPLVNKAKELGKKAAEFTEDKIQMTPLFIRTMDEYTKFLTEKRTILVAYDNSVDAVADEVRLHSSMWMARAFMDAAALKFVSINEYPELAHHIGLTGSLDMRIRYQGQETHRISTVEDMLAWWKDPSYTDEVQQDKISSTSSPETISPQDPLLTLNQK